MERRVSKPEALNYSIFSDKKAYGFPSSIMPAIFYEPGASFKKIFPVIPVSLTTISPLPNSKY